MLCCGSQAALNIWSWSLRVEDQGNNTRAPRALLQAPLYSSSQSPIAMKMIPFFFSKVESKETKGNYQENDDGIECLQISLTFKRWRRKIYNNWTRDIKRNKERAPPICITKKSPFLLFIHLLYF